MGHRIVSDMFHVEHTHLKVLNVPRGTLPRDSRPIPGSSLLSVPQAKLKLPMSIRIAIPEPTSLDSEYNTRSLPSYIQALQSAGATPVLIPLHERPDRVAKILATTTGILLPGSKFDIDPERYGAARQPECNPADPARAAVDELLLQDAFNLHKPVLAICYGVQSMNVWCSGTLIQDLPAAGYSQVNHAPGRTIAEAHTVDFTPGSRLASLAHGKTHEMVNSSHHQALANPGDNLHVTAMSPDGVIEAVEAGTEGHFALGVQWHPERTYTASELSRAIFGAFVREAAAWRAVQPVEQQA